MLKKVTIIGLGMMGASISLALKKRDPKIRTAAVVRKEMYVKPALDGKIVDEITVGIEKNTFRDTDIVIIAVPVFSIAGIMDDIVPFLEKKTLVTDIGSVKTLIVKHAESFSEDQIRFIGSHPMCGSEKAGMEYGDCDLFKGATCILTPTDKDHLEDIQRISDFWTFLGGRVVRMAPEEHDRQAAIISHMPHLLSSILMNHVSDMQRDKQSILDIAGSGFSDMTRLAEGIPSVWMDIFESNRDFIIKAAEGYKKGLEEIIQILKDNDKDKLFQYLKQGQQRKQKFEAKREKKP